ncbi:MAG: diaminopimelate epimerase [Thermoleophilia bacterium]|nr:diaminopimelate epimerase [Thermoleophilia bacterium]
MRSSKWHALGNSYLVVEPGDERLTPQAVRALCERADGVVEVVSAGEDDVEVTIWNADGSTAEMSGNGTRIAACWLAQRRGLERVRVRVGPREVGARILAGGEAETEVGDVEVRGRESVAGVELVVVSVGNPHAVIVGDPSDVVELGPLLTAHPRFPSGTNVEVARIDAPGQVTARVWERGVGETTASGTGAVAVAAATHGEGEVTVRFPGGLLHVRLADGRAFLVGPAVPME